MFAFSQRLAGQLFSLVSLIVLLACVANVPVAQLMVLGYFFESSGNVARTGKLAAGLIGLRHAAVIARVALCVLVVLIPLRWVTVFWVDASVIAPGSSQTQTLAVAQRILMVVSLLHIGSAVACGGLVRHFFWPLIVPCHLVWAAVKKFAGLFRRWFNVMPQQSVVPGIDADCRPWLVPKIIVRKVRSGRFYESSRDDTLAFLNRLRLPRLFVLGAKGGVGSMIWLLPSTLLMAASVGWRTEGNVLLAVLGVIVAVPVFLLLPMLQLQFAVDGRLSRFFDVRAAWSALRRAPLASLMAIALMQLLALPVFLLKIEKVPGELYWLLSVLFIVFGWPAKLIWGRVYYYAQKRQTPATWRLRWPVAVAMGSLTLVFVSFFFLTRFVSWNGTRSLFENHVFLLPIPFWF